MLKLLQIFLILLFILAFGDNSKAVDDEEITELGLEKAADINFIS